MAVTESATSARPRTDLLGAYEQGLPESQRLIATQLLPDLSAPDQAGKFGVLPRDTMFRRRVTRVSDTQESPTVDWSPKSGSYEIEPFRFKQFAPARMARIYGNWFNFEQHNARFCAHMIDLDYEGVVADMLMSNTLFPAADGKSFTASNPWTDVDNGTPLTDIVTGHDMFEARFMMPANAAVLTRKLARKLGLNAEILDRVKQIDPRITRVRIDEERLKELFEVDYVFLSEVYTNTSTPDEAGTQTGTNLWDWSKVLLTRVAPGADHTVPQLGRTFRPPEFGGVQIKTWEQNDPEGIFVKAEDEREANIMPDALGVLIEDVAA